MINNTFEPVLNNEGLDKQLLIEQLHKQILDQLSIVVFVTFIIGTLFGALMIWIYLKKVKK